MTYDPPDYAIESIQEAKRRSGLAMKNFEVNDRKITEIVETFDIFILLKRIEVVMQGVSKGMIGSASKYLVDSLYLGWKIPKWFVLNPNSYAERIKYLKWVLPEGEMA